VSAPTAAPGRRVVLRRRIRWLVAATITYNLIEAVIAITAGTIADSTALIGFGLDSLIEVSSAAAVAWQFAGPDPEHREKIALRVIAGSFFALAAYVSFEAVRTLIGADQPDHSPVGIALTAISVVIMPFLSWAQRRAGREYGSASAVADSKQTLLCTYLSAAVFAGLVLNSALGWWWADPIVALGLAVVAVREGREALRGDTCCPPIHLDDPDDAHDQHGQDGHGHEGEGRDRGHAGRSDADACGCAPGCSCCGGESR
jgi:divalent metal cation (Fe/Co/Zn/Cd) transporter